MRIAFIFAPFDHKKFEEDIDIVSKEFIQAPPLGLAYAASIAEKAGHEAIIIDANCRPRLSKEEVLDQIRSFNPHILGFMLTVYMFQQTMELIKFIKKETGLPVVVGNILLELYPAEVMLNKEIDYGIIGSAQYVLPKLLRALENKSGLENINGLCFKNNGKAVINYPESLKEDFVTLPFPARHLLPNHKYCCIISKKKNFTIMVTSKGCPSKCKFCHVGNIPYSARSPVAVADEIEECYRNHGIREIEFFDPVLTLDKKRVIDICDEIIKRNVDVSWACRARVDQVDRELLLKMKSAGCSRIYYGIECGNQSILDKINKGITLKNIEDIINLTKKIGILTLGFFIVGAPGDNADTIRETINFAMKLDLDYAQFHKTMAKPTTSLYEEVKKVTGRDYWKEYIMGIAPEERLPTPWTSVPDKEIENYVIAAYRKFYLKPSRLLRTILSIRSIHEFKRYARSALGLFRVRSDLSI